MNDLSDLQILCLPPSTMHTYYLFKLFRLVLLYLDLCLFFFLFNCQAEAAANNACKCKE